MILRTTTAFSNKPGGKPPRRRAKILIKSGAIDSASDLQPGLKRDSYD